jgi:hypothetical protein
MVNKIEFVFIIFLYFKMNIIIKFNDNIEHHYESFNEIIELDNYNEIIYIECRHNNLSSLPELPNSLIELRCYSNRLYCLPKLPNSLEMLWCSENNISSLPELPNSLKILWCDNNSLSNLPELTNSLEIMGCSNNNLSSLPELPNSLIYFSCNNNNLSSLPELPNSLNFLKYIHNPIHAHICKYFDGKKEKYFEYERNIKRKFSNKIGNWFLECRYNPKYMYCRKRLMKEYKELYG